MHNMNMVLPHHVRVRTSTRQGMGIRRRAGEGSEKLHLAGDKRDGRRDDSAVLLEVFMLYECNLT